MSLAAVLALLMAPAAGSAACTPYHEVPLQLPASAPWLTAEHRVRVVGYNDMDEMLRALAARFASYHPGISFEFNLPATRAAPAALTSGFSAFAPMGAEWPAREQSGFRARFGRAPLAIRIAGDSPDPRALSSPLAVYIHPENPASRLTYAQVRRAFSGGARTWRDLGVGGVWAKRSIHLYGPDRSFALAAAFRTSMLGAADFAPGYQESGKSREVVAAIAADPLALGYANLSHRGAWIKLLALGASRAGPWHDGSNADLATGGYPLDRHLRLYLSSRVPIAVAFTRFALSCEGQRVIAAGSLGYRALDSATLAQERRKIAAVDAAVRVASKKSALADRFLKGCGPNCAP